MPDLMDGKGYATWDLCDTREELGCDDGDRKSVV